MRLDGARGDLIQAAHGVEQGGLTATASAEDGHKTLLGKLQVHVVHDVELIALSLVVVLMRVGDPYGEIRHDLEPPFSVRSVFLTL